MCMRKPLHLLNTTQGFMSISQYNAQTHLLYRENKRRQEWSFSQVTKKYLQLWCNIWQIFFFFHKMQFHLWMIAFVLISLLVHNSISLFFMCFCWKYFDTFIFKKINSGIFHKWCPFFVYLNFWNSLDRRTENILQNLVFNIVVKSFLVQVAWLL